MRMWRKGFWRCASAVIFACTVLSTSSVLSPAFADKRIALVIGNDRYPNLPADRQLQKAANDAEAIGNAFSALGFEVIRGKNLGRQAIIDRLSDLTAKVGPGDTVALFYAGHGVAIDGINYILPSDVPAVGPGSESRVRGASISEPDLIAEIQAKRVRVALLVLDACRDNPFPRAGTRSIGNTRGLADAKPARGVFTIYSAGIGQSALDQLEPNDKNRNSVFTRIFVKELARPGMHLGDLAVEVREKVAELALLAKDEKGVTQPHDQTPAYYDQTVGGRIFLAGRDPVAEERRPAVPAPGPSAEDITWNFLRGSNDIGSLRRFLTEFPTTAHRTDAETRVAALERAAAEARNLADQERAKAIAKPAPSNQQAAVSPPNVPVAPQTTQPKPAVGVFSDNDPRQNTLLIDTTKGKIVIKLRPDLAPMHVERIKLLTREKYYDDVPFHRVMKEFMAQTGDGAKRDGTGGSKYPDLRAEFSSVPFKRGVIGMARRMPDDGNANSKFFDTANSQFFIMFADEPSLNGNHTVIGEVVTGMDVIDKLNRGEPPSTPDKMLKVQVAVDAK